MYLSFVYVHVNEAFAAQYLAAKEVGLDRDKTNGGAIALGCQYVASIRCENNCLPKP